MSPQAARLARAEARMWARWERVEACCIGRDDAESRAIVRRFYRAVHVRDLRRNQAGVTR